MSTGTFKSDVFPEHIEPFTKAYGIFMRIIIKSMVCDDKEGVVKVDEHFTKFEHLTVDDFLPNNSVMSIIEDPHDGGLWFSTQRGLLYIKDNHHKISLFMMAFPDTYLITLYRLQMMALFGGAMKGD